ncbi:hypothetical protein BJ878DRAFT_307718 [Calycina marina]|uniref:F-box domain-containing protein n=1 Tax=Calycina marina TaxID=1763456 RepID=A0A9P7Z5U7_9HELO|nr:hypothetical protein BJ878DRAFT_307718 [Calycina marina]
MVTEPGDFTTISIPASIPYPQSPAMTEPDSPSESIHPLMDGIQTSVTESQAGFSTPSPDPDHLEAASTLLSLEQRNANSNQGIVDKQGWPPVNKPRTFLPSQPTRQDPSPNISTPALPHHPQSLAYIAGSRMPSQRSRAAVGNAVPALAPRPSLQHLQIQAKPSSPSMSMSRSVTPMTVSKHVKLAQLAPKKRKAEDTIEKTTANSFPKKSRKLPVKRANGDKEPKPEKVFKEKKSAPRLDTDVWMRILEFTPPSFYGRARLICKEINTLITTKDSILKNQRLENYGPDMPGPLEDMTEREYSNLLGTHKGCSDCDDKSAMRVHWSWQKRWCHTCWKGKLEREDKVIKNNAHSYLRPIMLKMLECIPYGMHDSYMKPHNFVDEETERGRSPRLYKYYLVQDVKAIIEEYKSLTPKEFVEDPSHTTPEEKAVALNSHEIESEKMERKREDVLDKKKRLIETQMAWVRKVEAGIKLRRDKNGLPHEKCRQARRELFLRRAMEDLYEECDGMDDDFVRRSKCFKDATRIYRDAGTERGWQTLKPKIVEAWEKKKKEEKDAPIQKADSAAQTTTGTPVSDHRDSQTASIRTCDPPSRLPSVNSHHRQFGNTIPQIQHGQNTMNFSLQQSGLSLSGMFGNSGLGGLTPSRQCTGIARFDTPGSRQLSHQAMTSNDFKAHLTLQTQQRQRAQQFGLQNDASSPGFGANHPYNPPSYNYAALGSYNSLHHMGTGTFVSHSPTTTYPATTNSTMYNLPLFPNQQALPQSWGNSQSNVFASYQPQHQQDSYAPPLGGYQPHPHQHQQQRSEQHKMAISSMINHNPHHNPNF